MANVILTNGARLYVDHAHPEYSGPEVTSALDAVRYDKAGDAVMAIAAQRATQSLGRSVRLYKNNTDGKGASYGTHENYLLQRSTPFDRIVTQFTAYLVTRQVITGAGRVGIGQASQQPGFQISQRADFFEAEVGLETTLNRPIINTRDEPHADASRHRRLHVITGDANLSEIATYLKVGSAAWVLRVIEAGELGGDLRLDAPVAAMRAVSHDLSCAETVLLADGRSFSPVDVQETYLDACRQHYERVAGDLTEAARIEAKDVFTRWQDCLDALRSDIFSLADQLDWVAKLKLMESYRQRDGLGWAAPKLALIDLQYADVDPRRSLYRALLAKGKMRRLVTDEEIERARTSPPEDTRAYFRGKVMEKFGASVVAASWDSVIFDVPDRPALQRIPLLDPLRGTREQVGQMIAECNTVTDLFAALGRCWTAGSLETLIGCTNRTAMASVEVVRRAPLRPPLPPCPSLPDRRSLSTRVWETRPSPASVNGKPVAVLGGQPLRRPGQPGLDQQLGELGHADPLQPDQHRGVPVEVREW